MRWVSIVPLIAVLSASAHLAQAREKPLAPATPPDPLAFIYRGGDAERHCRPLADWYAAGMGGQAPASASVCSGWLQLATSRYCAAFDKARQARLLMTFLNLRR